MKYILTAAAVLALAPVANAGEIKIQYSEDFTEALNDDYGVREGEYLSRRITEKVGDALNGDLDRLGDIVITIEDAKPNRPTHKQMTDKVGLSYQSFSLGGIKLNGQVFDTEGKLLVSVTDDYYSHDIRWAQYNAKWADAIHGTNQFVGKLDRATEEALDMETES